MYLVLFVIDECRIHAMERKSAIPAKYLFPQFETTHWYAARGLVHDLKRYHKKIIPSHVHQGVRELYKMLKAWVDDYEVRISYYFYEVIHSCCFDLA